MCLSNWAFASLAVVTLAAWDSRGMIQAADKLPPTIDIGCQPGKRKPVFRCREIRLDNFPVRNFFIQGYFSEDNGTLYPVRQFEWFLQATPEVLPDDWLLRVGSKFDGLKEGQLIPLCGHVYRFTRKGNEGLLTLLPDHPMQHSPQDMARYFSALRTFTWGEDKATPNQIVKVGEDGWLSIRSYTTLSKSEAAAVVNLSIQKADRSLDLDQVLKYKLEKVDDKVHTRKIKVDDHIKTESFDFVVRRIIPPDGKDNPGWIDLELLTGAQAAQDK